MGEAGGLAGIQASSVWHFTGNPLAMLASGYKKRRSGQPLPGQGKARGLLGQGVSFVFLSFVPMPPKSLNTNLQAAKAGKKDEFYTQLDDIEKELKHYKAHFRGKTVFCNCDDPRISNFFPYFSNGFKNLGLKKLITCYKNQDMGWFKLA